LFIGPKVNETVIAATAAGTGLLRALLVVGAFATVEHGKPGGLVVVQLMEEGRN
jgi:hypothetical protein